MLEKLIDDILAAEHNAEKIISKAEAEAMSAKFSKDADLEKRRGSFLEERRIAREQTYANAEKKAEKSYDVALADAEKEAGRLSKSADRKMDEAVELILRRLTDTR